MQRSTTESKLLYLKQSQILEINIYRNEKIDAFRIASEIEVSEHQCTPASKAEPVRFWGRPDAMQHESGGLRGTPSDTPGTQKRYS